MPTKKTLAKPKDSKAQVIRTEMTKCRTLKVFHKNPRIGNVDKIAKSLHLNGQYRSIVVNVGTYTGRPNEILAGNHTYLAARKPLAWQSRGVMYDKPAWDEVLVSFVDVDDERATAINLADNKIAEDGAYDDYIIKELIESLPDDWNELADATGFSEHALNDILTSLDNDRTGAVPSVDDDDEELIAAPPAPRQKPVFEDTDFGDEDEADDVAPSVGSRAAKTEEQEEEEEEYVGPDMVDADEELKGNLLLKDTGYYEGVGYWQIPKTIPSMFAKPEDLPAKLSAWAGSATKDNDDPDQWWLYNYGVDSTSGMRQPLSQVIPCFFTYDEYFEPWWFQPSRYVSKVLNSKCSLIVSPDFTDDTRMGRAFCLWQLYRIRWMVRYFQEAGLKVIMNMSWPHGDIDYLKEQVLPTLPKQLDLIAMQAQTFNKKVGEEEIAKAAVEDQLVIDTLKPKMVLLYSGQPGYDYFMERIKFDGDVRFILNRQAKLSARAKGRKRKVSL